VEDRESRVIKVTKEEWLAELLRAMWRQLGIEDIEKYGSWNTCNHTGWHCTRKPIGHSSGQDLSHYSTVHEIFTTKR